MNWRARASVTDTWNNELAVNVNRTYRRKMAKLAGVPLDQFDYWFKRAVTQTNSDPAKDVVVIAKAMKQMFRQNMRTHR
jgi:hypothetical protein